MTLLEPAAPAVLPAPRTPLSSPGRREQSPDAEEQSITRVIELLVTDFPDVPEPDVRDCVARIRADFARARVRTYIPILVARRARAALLAHPSPVRLEPGGNGHAVPDGVPVG